MTENSLQFDLIKIFNTILKSWKFIFGFVLVSLLAGLLFFLLGTPKYETKTTFILRDPLETERNQMLSQDFFQNKRYFADEDNVDEVMAISKTDAIYDAINQQFDLVNKKGKSAVAYLRKNLEVKRNDTREIEIAYADPDKELSAAITNYTREFLQEKYENYFKSLHQNIITHLQSQITDLDHHIMTVDHSIDSVRAQFGLADQLLPYRGEAIVNERAAGSVEKAKGMEILVGYTRMKDRMNEERADMITLIHEYSIGLKEGTKLGSFNVIQEAHPDTHRKLPNAFILFGGIALASLLLACMVALIRGRKVFIKH